MTGPDADLDTLFLDAGNTLICMDFERIAREARRVGVECDAAALRRAEAAARPDVSARAARNRTTEGEDAFLAYVRDVLVRLPGAATPPPAETVRDLGRALRAVHAAGDLWNEVMDGVPEALTALRGAGLRLVVVSNSDGSVEEQLRDAGLAGHLDRVFDSHRVGHEKPDPRIFAHALAACGADPARTLHVGDLFDVDVVGARSAGIHAALLDPHGDWVGREVDCLRVPDLAGLAKLVIEARRGAGV